MAVNHAIKIFRKFVVMEWERLIFFTVEHILKDIDIGNFPDSMKVLTLLYVLYFFSSCTLYINIVKHFCCDDFEYSYQVQMPQDLLHMAAYVASLHLVEVVAAEQSLCESPQPAEKKCAVKCLCL
jgi:hypothetical protein